MKFNDKLSEEQMRKKLEKINDYLNEALLYVNGDLEIEKELTQKNIIKARDIVEEELKNK